MPVWTLGTVESELPGCMGGSRVVEQASQDINDGASSPDESRQSVRVAGATPATGEKPP